MGKSIVISAPSGAGKISVVNSLVEKIDNIKFSVSACNRKKRAGEVDGKNYHFLSTNEFNVKIKEGSFLEWEEVYPNKYYGTLNSSVNEIWQEGKHVIFDIDVVGALNIKNKFQDDCLAVFISPPSFSILKERLLARGTEQDDELKTRLAKVKEELDFQDKFDYIIINDNLSDACEKAFNLVKDFLNK